MIAIFGRCDELWMHGHPGNGAGQDQRFPTMDTEFTGFVGAFDGVLKKIQGR